jgi:hypothetical protein
MELELDGRRGPPAGSTHSLLKGEGRDQMQYPEQPDRKKAERYVRCIGTLRFTRKAPRFQAGRQQGGQENLTYSVDYGRFAGGHISCAAARDREPPRGKNQGKRQVIDIAAVYSNVEV